MFFLLDSSSPSSTKEHNSEKEISPSVKLGPDGQTIDSGSENFPDGRKIPTLQFPIVLTKFSSCWKLPCDANSNPFQTRSYKAVMVSLPSFVD